MKKGRSNFYGSYENRSKPSPYLIHLVIWNNIYPCFQSLSVGDKQLITVPSSHYVLLLISGNTFQEDED